jgi:hypothetical protein
MTDIAGERRAAQQARGQWIGSLVGAAFGLIYLEVNAAPLPTGAARAVRLLGVAAFVGVAVVLGRNWPRDGDEPGDASDDGAEPLFGRRYWFVVLVEVVALMVGLRLLDGPLGMPEAGVAWVSLVVGAHFVPLSVLFRAPLFLWLGVAIAACGVAGLVLAATGASDAAIAVVSGLVPGVLLLGWSAVGAWTVGDAPVPEENRR